MFKKLFLLIMLSSVAANVMADTFTGTINRLILTRGSTNVESKATVVFDDITGMSGGCFYALVILNNLSDSAGKAMLSALVTAKVTNAEIAVGYSPYTPSGVLCDITSVELK